MRWKLTTCCVESWKFDEYLKVILDNKTRWNSTFLSLRRGFRLQRVIHNFCLTHDDFPQQDPLSGEEWNHLRQLCECLKPFHDVSMRLQGHGKAGHHGSVWEALPALEALLRSAEQGRQRAQNEREEQLLALNAEPEGGGPAEATRHRSIRRPVVGVAPPPSTETASSCAIDLQVAIRWQNAWEVLQKYNEKSDDSFGIFAAATLLNPSLRRRCFDYYWTESSGRFIEPMLETVRKQWENEYTKHQALSSTPRQYRSLVDLIGMQARQNHPQSSNADAFNSYINGGDESYEDWRERSIFDWWNTHFPTLRQWAFDTLSVPATSAECERIFSFAKRMVGQDRASLSIETMEMMSCLHHWSDNELWAI